MKLDHIRRAWESYREIVVPPDAGVVQVEESRQAFYAGATALFYLLTKQSDQGGILTPGLEAEAADLATMDGLEGELKAFAATQGGRT